jgi:hypothetical protein
VTLTSAAATASLSYIGPVNDDLTIILSTAAVNLPSLSVGGDLFVRSGT